MEELNDTEYVVRRAGLAKFKDPHNTNYEHQHGRGRGRPVFKRAKDVIGQEHNDAFGNVLKQRKPGKNRWPESRPETQRQSGRPR